MAEMRQAEARAQRRRRLAAVGGVIAAVVILAVVLVAVGLNSGSDSTASTTSSSSATSGKAVDDVVSRATSVSPATYNTVGAGAGIQAKPARIHAPALRASGKPKVVYVGAEYCPYCAAERWAVVAALSRFGTFSGLGETTSGSEDIYPSTATLSFHGAHYRSRYLAFSGTEIQSNKRVGSSYAPLDKLSAADQKTLQTYDTLKYTGSGTGSIPFLDLGGRYVSAGANYDPQLLADMSHQEIADAMHDPNSDVGKAIDGAANLLTAHLCELTGGKPGKVCTSAGVTAAE